MGVGVIISLGERLFPSTDSLPTTALSPLDATLMDLPASVANKRLTVRLNPLDATLTKNTGVGDRSPSLRHRRSDVQTCGRSEVFPSYPLCFQVLAHSSTQRPPPNPFLINRFRTLLVATEGAPPVRLVHSQGFAERQGPHPRIL